jgi:hypothetical protein
LKRDPKFSSVQIVTKTIVFSVRYGSSFGLDLTVTEQNKAKAKEG